MNKPLLGLNTVLYQPIERADLEASEVKQPCIERLEMITKELGPEVGTLLDLGCHTGWFCRAFARLGWRTVGIDRSEEWLFTARVLNDLVEGVPHQPYYIQADLDRPPCLPQAEVALCLSVAMYLFERGHGWEFLDKVSRAAPVMFLDFGGMYAHHLPFTEENAIEAILARTEYTRGKLLGHSDFEDRPLFMFTR